MVTIIIGADHNGFEHKNFIKEALTKEGYTVIDVGPETHDPDDDYPDFAIPLAQKVAANEGVGVFICGSGNGPCMVANKTHGIRAGISRQAEDAVGIRSHQNANVVCIGAEFTDKETALEIVKTFLETEKVEAKLRYLFRRKIRARTLFWQSCSRKSLW